MATTFVRSAVDQIIQLGVEPNIGQQAPVMRRLPSVSIDLKPLSETQRFRAMGFNVDTVSIIHKQWANGTWSGPADFDQIVYPLCGLVGMPASNTPTQLVMNQSYEWDFNPVSQGADLFSRTFTCEYGDSTAAMRALLLKFQSLTLEWSNDNLNTSGNLFCRFPKDGQTLSAASNEEQNLHVDATGGTFTMTFGANTTGNLAYNTSTAAQIQAALEALLSIGAGNVVCGGGPLPGTDVQIVFIGNLAGTSEALITTDSTLLTGGTHTATVTRLVAGGGAIVTVQQSPGSRMQVDVFADDTFGAIGTTKVAAAYEASLTVADKFQPFWVLNTDYSSFADIVRVAAEVNGAFSTAHNTQSQAFYAQIVTNPTKYMRYRVKGVDLGGGNFQLIQVDFAGRFAQPEIQKDANGAFGFKYNFNAIHDSALGGAWRIKVVNPLTGL